MIVSDHGMAPGTPQSGAEYVEIDDYLDMDDVSHVIDRAALAAVAPLPGKTDKVFRQPDNNINFSAQKNVYKFLQVYKQLKQMRGVDVYRRDDIPDSYHYKNGRYVQEILVCAKPGKVIHFDGKNLSKFKEKTLTRIRYKRS